MRNSSLAGVSAGGCACGQSRAAPRVGVPSFLVPFRRWTRCCFYRCFRRGGPVGWALQPGKIRHLVSGRAACAAEGAPWLRKFCGDGGPGKSGIWSAVVQPVPQRDAVAKEILWARQPGKSGICGGGRKNFLRRKEVIRKKRLTLHQNGSGCHAAPDEKGTRCESGTVPAAVSPWKGRRNLPLARCREGAMIGTSQKTCHSRIEFIPAGARVEVL